MRPTDITQLPEPLSSFQPLQIVCLEDTLYRLYAEVVQTVETKRTCWVRPLLLAEHNRHLDLYSDRSSEWPRIYDLRQGSDLLLPTILFRVAMDVEVIPLLSQLETLDESKNPVQEARLRLNQFVKDVCLSRPEIFSSPMEKPQSEKVD